MSALELSCRTSCQSVVYFTFSIKPDKSGLYYSWAEAGGPRVSYHAMGSDPAKDREVFGQGYGPDKIILCDLSEDGRYLTIHVLYGSAADRTEIYYQDLEKQGPIRPLVNDIPARFFGRGWRQSGLSANQLESPQWTSPRRGPRESGA